MVQVYASSIIIRKSLIERILPSFLGPWSDKFGRKPLSVGGSFDVIDFVKILVGCLSGFAAAVTFAFTWKPWHIYLGSVLGILTGVIVPISRSAISKSVLSDDLDKVFSVVSFIETILPLGSASLYTLVYSSYIADYPTPVFLLSTIMYFFMVVIAGVMNSKFVRYHNSEQ